MFNDIVLLFGQGEVGETRSDQEEVRVSRSSTEENPDTYNDVFDCRPNYNTSRAFEKFKTMPGILKVI